MWRKLVVLNSNKIQRIILSSNVQKAFCSTKNLHPEFPESYGKHQFPDSQNKVIISTEEWPFVEKLLPMKVKPEINTSPGEKLPSGFTMPSATIDDYSYTVQRNSSGMLPVYMKRRKSEKTDWSFTIVKNAEGNLHDLAKEIVEFLTYVQVYAEDVPYTISYEIQEPWYRIRFEGDYVVPIKEFLTAKGF